MSDDGEYEIGKGKPPRWGRFKKGKSGNPKGRPKKDKASLRSGDESAFDEIFREELDRKYRVKDGDGTRELKGIEVVVRTAITTAAKGNAAALREVLYQARKVEENEAKRNDETKRKEAESFENMVRYRAVRQMEWERALANEREPDEPWPHPDDILISANRRTWTVRGPFAASDLPRFEYLRAERDAAFAQSELMLREHGRRGDPLLRIWDIVWQQFDAMLPLRWQVMPILDRMQIGVAQLSKREVRKIRDRSLADADILRPLSGIPGRTKETYRIVNSIMKPALQKLGYRSLAQFEGAFDGIGESG